MPAAASGLGLALSSTEPTGWGSRDLWLEVQPGAVSRGACPRSPSFSSLSLAMKKYSAWPGGDAGSGVAAVFLALVMQAWLSCLYSTTLTLRPWPCLCPH